MPQASEAAAAVQRHMERTSFRLQQLKCADCGFEVASPELSCCRQVTTNSLRLSFRVAQTTIDSAFGTEVHPVEWRSASDASVAQWLAAHRHSACENSLPVVLCHSDKARALQSDIIQWLNSLRKSSALNCVYSKFLPRPWSVTANSLKCSTATQFIRSATQTANFQDYLADPTPLPHHEEFGRLLDSLLKSSIKFSPGPDPVRNPEESRHASRTHVLSGEWRPSEPAFTPLTICQWQFGDLLVCEETDALFGRHIVELKTMSRVEIATSGDGDHAADAADVAGSDADARQIGCTLGDHTRQMAVSLMALQETHPLGLLVMVGREDHRVLVLEVAEDQALEQQRRKLPAACEWIYSSWSSWFQAQPQLMNAFLKLSRPYSHECANRKSEWDLYRNTGCRGTRPDFSGWSHYLDLVSSGEKERLDALVSAALGPDRHGDGDVGGKSFGGFGGRASGASSAAE